MAPLYSLLLLYLPLLLSLYPIYFHFKSKLQNLPPSPFPSLPIIGHLHLLGRPLHRSLSTISANHGPLVLLRFGIRRVLIVSSPALADQCLSKNDIVFANRPALVVARRFAYNCTTLVFSPYGDHWRNLRRIASTELLSTHRVQSLAAIRGKEVKSLIQWMFGKVVGGQVVNMKVALFEVTLNVMMSMIAGKRYYGENVSDVEEAKRFREIHEEAFRLNGKTNLEDFLPWVRSKELERKMIECHRKRDGFLQGLIDEQRGKEDDQNLNLKQRKCLIQVMLSLQRKEPDYYTDDTIKGLMLDLLSAGTDTSSNTMEWALALLLNNPSALTKAQSELERVVGNERFVEETDLPKLEYLQGIIKETMRMHPALPLLIPHESSQDCVVGGYRVPSNTILLINSWNIHNDPKIWKDPHDFKPERFLGLGDHGLRFLPFGYGRRSCPGEGLGMKMVSFTLSTLIQCFHFDKANDSEPVDMTEQTGFTMAKALPLTVVPRPRPAMLHLLS
ncbi:Cytochrome P450 81Q32 [Linum grandiflorum]